MNLDQIILFVCVAGAIGGGVLFLARMVVAKPNNRLLGRLKNEQGQDASDIEKLSAAPSGGMASIARSIGQAAASPFMPKDGKRHSGLRKQLSQAGVYQPSALRAITGFKLILLVGGLFVGYLLDLMLNRFPLLTAVGGLAGYMMPMIWLRTRINSNQMSLQTGLPDALDLMVVCVEAGLTVDAAMSRVGEELAIAHPAVSREFGIAHMETRIGLSRAEAMKNMGIRTGNAAIQQLVAMLVQADRFGTSVAQALRIQSETLRIKRQHIAEELAAKASVKMSFPLVLFIFPATFIVLAGPTVIGLMNSEIMKG